MFLSKYWGGGGGVSVGHSTLVVIRLVGMNCVFVNVLGGICRTFDPGSDKVSRHELCFCQSIGGGGVSVGHAILAVIRLVGMNCVFVKVLGGGGVSVGHSTLVVIRLVDMNCVFVKVLGGYL